jgi:hypothetical protein
MTDYFDPKRARIIDDLVARGQDRQWLEELLPGEEFETTTRSIYDKLASAPSPGDCLLIPLNTLPLSTRTYAPPPVSPEDDAEQWRQAEATFREWRASGATYAEFMTDFDEQRARDQYWAYFRLPGGDVPEPWPPGHEAQFEKHAEKRFIVRNALNHGYCGFQAAQEADLDRPANHNDWPEKLKQQNAKLVKANTEKDETIEAGRRQDIAKDRRIEELEHTVKKLERELEAWKASAAGTPGRGPLGRWR